MSYFIKTAKSYNTSIVMNTSMSLKYVEKKKNVTYVQHSIMIIRCVIFEMYQQNINASIAIRIIQYKLQNATKKNM